MIHTGFVRRLLLAGLLLAIILFPVAAAGTAEETAEVSAEQVTATDSLGREVSVEAYPDRIAVVGKATMIVADALYLFPEAREDVVGLGKTDQGLGDFFTYIAPDFPATERTSHAAGAEEIAAMNPDLVLIKHYVYGSLGEQLEKLGLPVFTLNLESTDAYFEEIEQLGILLGMEERASDITGYYHDRLSYIREQVSQNSADEREEILLLYASARDGITAFQTPPKSWMQTDMAEKAGAEAIWKESNLTDGWQKVGFEQIASWDPDRIYIISYRAPTDTFLDQIAESDAWEGLQAYQNGEVKAFPADFHNWAQPDTRWILGLEWLSRDLHPEAFQGTSMEESITDFYKELYRITDEDIVEEILQRYENSL
ncbi:MAG: ABC transporter substrate-binding protein [Spirochaetota bacterium]